MDQEIWKDVVGYEGLYKISNLGQVYSIRNNRMLTPCISHKSDKGYYRVRLYGTDGKTCKTKMIHRMLAEAFIINDDPVNKDTVNHLNGNKLDNSLDNLEWCTRIENTRHAYKNNLGNFVEKGAEALQKANQQNRKSSGYVLIVMICNKNPLNKCVFDSSLSAATVFNTTVCNIVGSIRQHQSVYKYAIYGFKNEDLLKFANGEPLPEVLKGIPWEDYIIKDDIVTCNDYPSEGE